MSDDDKPLTPQPSTDGKECCNPYHAPYIYGGGTSAPANPCPNCPLRSTRAVSAPQSDTRPIAEQYDVIRRGMDAIAPAPKRADWALHASLEARGLLGVDRTVVFNYRDAQALGIDPEREAAIAATVKLARNSAYGAVTPKHADDPTAKRPGCDTEPSPNAPKGAADMRAIPERDALIGFRDVGAVAWVYGRERRSEYGDVKYTVQCKGRTADAKVALYIRRGSMSEETFEDLFTSGREVSAQYILAWVHDWTFHIAHKPRHA